MSILKEWAKKLNGRECDEELTPEEEKELKEQGLIVVFGVSDDLCEFRGAIHDEVGCYDGGNVYINSSGPYTTDDYDYNEQEDLQANIKRSKKIIAKWCDPLSLVTWTYETDIPHEEFSVMEDGETYCKGIIFNIKSLEG